MGLTISQIRDRTLRARHLMQRSRQQGFAVGAFNIDNQETLIAVARAAQKLNAPVLVEVSQGEVDALGLENIRDMVDNYRDEYGIEIYINLDHSPTVEACKRAIDVGFEFIHIDISQANHDASEEEIIAKTKEVVKACKDNNIPIRIGVNGGSLEKDLLNQYGGPVAEAMVESAMRHVRILEDLDFQDIVISLKNSDVIRSIEAYRLMSKTVDYPLHLGITEAGGIKRGTIKSAIGVGSLLADGIGDTIRISLTGDPTEEIPVAKDILRSLDLLNDKIKIVSCPTCGRCNINLIDLANEVEDKISSLEKDITVAIMGCAVNGPGEAREADIGIAGGDKVGLLFKKGEIVKKISQETIVDTLLEEINNM